MELDVDQHRGGTAPTTRRPEVDPASGVVSVERWQLMAVAGVLVALLAAVCLMVGYMWASPTAPATTVREPAASAPLEDPTPAVTAPSTGTGADVVPTAPLTDVVTPPPLPPPVEPEIEDAEGSDTVSAEVDTYIDSTGCVNEDYGTGTDAYLNPMSECQAAEHLPDGMSKDDLHPQLWWVFYECIMSATTDQYDLCRDEYLNDPDA